MDITTKTGDNMATDTIEQNNFNFGIQDSGMGMGSTELLKDLLSPESATVEPEEIKKIEEVEEEKPTPVEKTPAITKAVKEVDKEEEDTENPLASFFNDNEPEEVSESKTEDIKDTVTSKKTAEDDPSEPEIPSEGEHNPFKAFSEDLFNLGVFTKDEGEEDAKIDTPEAFLERFNIEKRKGAISMVNDFIGQFGQDYQNAFDAIFVKGMDPKEYFTTVGEIGNLSDLDLSVESNQEKVVRRMLEEQGFEGEDIDNEVERLKNYGDLETVAQRHHKVIIKKEAADLQEKTLEAENLQKHKAHVKQTYISNVNTLLNEKLKEKEFDGIPLNNKIANELQDFLLVDKWRTESGETLTDFDRYILDLKKPENHEMKVKVGLLLKLLEKDPTLSTIQKSGVSKQTNTLFKEVTRQVKSASPSRTTRDTPTRWFN